MRLLKFTLFFHIVFLGHTQEHPPVMTFPPEIYNAANQNWGITQSDDLKMYFANNKNAFKHSYYNTLNYLV